MHKKTLLILFLLFTWVPQLRTEGFLAGTLIKTVSGYVPIEQLIIGDIVVSYDHKNNCYTQYPITCVACSAADFCIKIQINDEYIYASPEQKFYVCNKRKWLAAHDLKVNDILMTVDGSEIGINAIKVINQQCTLHSLSVETNHTLCVSHNDIIAHNMVPIVAQITLTIGQAVTPIIQSILPIIQSTVIIGCATLLSKLAQKISHKNRHTTNNTQSISINNNSNGGGWNDPDDDNNNEKKHPNGTYKSASYHHKNSKNGKSKCPKNGQSLLDKAFKVEDSPNTFIAMEENTFVVFYKTMENEFHAHIRIWKELTPFMKNTLINQGLVRRSGKIIKNALEAYERL